MSPFFVGWMGLPRSLVGFIAVVVLAVATVGAVFAALIIAATPPHQTGQWGSDEVGYDGVLVIKPYPLVRVAAAGNQPARAILLVDEWKFGLPLGPEFKDGQFVHVQGYAVRRGDVTVLQVDQKPRPMAGTAPPVAERRDAGVQTLTGEIADTKCWTGAMNPGEGKTHKGCGSLCLLGAIPALFITAGPDATPRWYVLADTDGNALSEEMRAHVGERLSLTGHVVEAADLHEFRIDRQSAERVLAEVSIVRP
jgi:hypothetical protein